MTASAGTTRTAIGCTATAAPSATARATAAGVNLQRGEDGQAERHRSSGCPSRPSRSTRGPLRRRPGRSAGASRPEAPGQGIEGEERGARERHIPAHEGPAGRGGECREAGPHLEVQGNADHGGPAPGGAGTRSCRGTRLQVARGRGRRHRGSCPTGRSARTRRSGGPHDRPQRDVLLPTTRVTHLRSRGGVALCPLVARCPHGDHKPGPIPWMPRSSVAHRRPMPSFGTKSAAVGGGSSAGVRRPVDSVAGMKVTMLLCDAVQVADGKLYILGGGWSIIGRPGPSAVAVKIEVDLARGRPAAPLGPHLGGRRRACGDGRERPRAPNRRGRGEVHGHHPSGVPEGSPHRRRPGRQRRRHRTGGRHAGTPALVIDDESWPGRRSVSPIVHTPSRAGRPATPYYTRPMTTHDRPFAATSEDFVVGDVYRHWPGKTITSPTTTCSAC